MPEEVTDKEIKDLEKELKPILWQDIAIELMK